MKVGAAPEEDRSGLRQSGPTLTDGEAVGKDGAPGTIDDSIRLVGNVCRRIAPPNAPPLALLHPNPEPQKADKGKGRQRR